MVKLLRKLAFVTGLGAVALGVPWWQSGDFVGLWLTPDQQGRLAYERFDYLAAAERFEDPMWIGLAAYEAGHYEESANSFGRVPTAEAFYNRGNSLMKSADYGKAIVAYEQAVLEAPQWSEAADNLRLAKYVLDYIEQLREDTDTGDDKELGADEIKFDKTGEKGREVVITRESTIGIESAEKWMRSVDTQTRDFLRVRFAMESIDKDPR